MIPRSLEVGWVLQPWQRFCVPIYQRHYVWKRQKQWEPFWEDVRTKAIERISGRDRRFYHFMGALVLESKGGFSAGKVPSFQVVDGQQRLTTFILFLCAARDYALKVGLPATAERIKDYIINDKEHLMTEPEVEKYKVWPTQYDRELFIDLVTGDRSLLRKKYRVHFYKTRDQVHTYSTVPALLSGYGFFYDRIKNAVETDDLDDELSPVSIPEEPEDEETPTPQIDAQGEAKLDAIWKALVEEFKVVAITLEDGDDAQIIFETLNERGEPLLAADLVRNNIFYRAEANDEHAEKLFATHWKDFEDSFWEVKEKQGRYQKPRIEFFLSNFISGQIAGDVNLSKLFSEYKAFLAPRKNSSTPRFPDVETELKTLASYGATYRELLERSSGSILADFSKRLAPWDVTTAYPLVLRLWKSDMDDAAKQSCLNLILTYIVRRAVCGLDAKYYNKFFLATVAYLEKNTWTQQSFEQFFTSQQSKTARMPRDEEFGRAWLNRAIYPALQARKVRAVLTEIEIAKRNKMHETTGISGNLTVEHVLPQAWLAHWPLPDGSTPTSEQYLMGQFTPPGEDSLEGQIAKRNQLKESFGNLTLLTQPLNSTVSNGPFSGKKDALKEHSLLVLNSEIARQDTWDETKILERGAQLFDLAKTIWPIPSIADDHIQGGD